MQINRQGCLNSAMDPKQVDEVCHLDDASQKMIDQAINRLGFSARAYHRILKLSRTIADLCESKSIQQSQLGQAIQLRNLDRAP